jgi:DNA-binding CsgD family transcriptional regulator
MSQLVTWQDARAVFRLLDEVKQLGHEPLAWRRHLLTSLASLVRAQVGMAAEVPEGCLLEPSRHVGCVDTGWELGGCAYTRRRGGVTADRNWYRSVIFNAHHRTSWINHYLLSHLPIPGRRIAHYVFLIKARSEGPFTQRDQLLVHHLHEELGELWKVEGQTRLPRRLQQTLNLLHAGYSEKQVAEKLAISPATVHDYCKALHKRWKVHSRAELLARTRALPHAPRLVMQE